MPESQKIRVVREFFENFNSGDIEEARRWLADDITYEGPEVPEIWWAKGRIAGADNIVSEMIDDIGEHFESLAVDIEDIYESGPWVVLIARHRGRTRAGVTFNSALVQVYTVDGDKAVRLQDYPDTDSWMEKVVNQ